MHFSFKPSPPEPEDRLRVAFKRFLRQLKLEASPQCMLWIRDKSVMRWTEAELAWKTRTTVLLAYMETHPTARQGLDGAFVCGQGKAIQKFIDDVLRKVMSESRMAGEDNDEQSVA